MKTRSIVLSILALFVFNAFGFAQSAKKETIKVWGNCEMCQKKIETAATRAGASSAKWNSETKVLAVSYNTQKTNSDKIQKAIAAVGYDTQNFTASEEAYNKLHACCQYDRKGDEGAAATDKKAGCCSDDKCKKEECKDQCKDKDHAANGKDCCKDKSCCKS